MIGLEFVCKVFKKEQKELAEKLKIAPPNISSWLKGAREIPTKYLPELSKIFNGISPEYFQKELTYVDELKVQIYYLEKALGWDDRQEEFTVSAIDDSETLVVNETYDLYEDRLKHLYQELNKAIKVNSYQDRIKVLLEQVWALDNVKKAELFKDKNAEEFIVSRLNNYIDFLSKFQVKEISTIDLVVNYLVNYQGKEQNKWGEQDVFPNEKLLAFYSDLKEVFSKHSVI